MSILQSIISKIFHASTQITTAVSPQQAQAATGVGQPNASPAGEQPQAQQQPTAQPASAPLSQVDVHAVLSQLASRNGETLNWQQSIVDLLKLLDLDSSLQSRKELAKELNYTGNPEDSAPMNIWLHKQVMEKLADNGGKVPDSLRAA